MNAIEVLPVCCISLGKGLVAEAGDLLQARDICQKATCTTSVTFFHHVQFGIPTDIVFRIRTSKYSLLGVPYRQIWSAALPGFFVTVTLIFTEFFAFAFVNSLPRRGTRT